MMDFDFKSKTGESMAEFLARVGEQCAIDPNSVEQIMKEGISGMLEHQLEAECIGLANAYHNLGSFAEYLLMEDPKPPTIYEAVMEFVSLSINAMHRMHFKFIAMRTMNLEGDKAEELYDMLCEEITRKNQADDGYSDAGGAIMKATGITPEKIEMWMGTGPYHTYMKNKRRQRN